MKPIELTEEHKSKLLEMCKILFSKYEELYLGINDYDLEPDGYIYFMINKNITRIHWFEFCITHLISKISEIEDSKLGDDDPDSIHMNIINLCRKKYDHLCKNILDSWSNYIHPIDYLYEEFKKLQPKEQYANEHICHIMNINKHVKYK